MRVAACLTYRLLVPPACQLYVLLACLTYRLRLPKCTAYQVVSNLGSSDIDARLEELLIDGILFAFQEQVCPARAL